MVFVNGSPLTQVLSFTDLRPGTFYFSDTYQLLHITPPPAPIWPQPWLKAQFGPPRLT